MIRDTWAKLPGTTYTTDINDIYDDPAIQLVVVTTPNHLHFETAKDALLHGKNVLLEKPFTETYAQAQELLLWLQKRTVDSMLSKSPLRF